MAQCIQIAKVNWWHHSIIEWLIANPEKSLAECADKFNVTQSWLSVVKNSDAFDQLFQERRAEHFSNTSKGLVERVEKLAELTVDRLTDVIENEEVTFKALHATADLALSKLGFGSTSARNSQAVQVVVNVADRCSVAHAQ